MICPYGRPKHSGNPISRRCIITLYLYSRPFLLPCMYCRQEGSPGDSSELVHSSSHRSNNLKTLPFTHTQLISNKPYSGTCASGAAGFSTGLNLPLICFSPPTPPHQDAGVLCAKDRISFSRRRHILHHIVSAVILLSVCQEMQGIGLNPSLHALCSVVILLRCA